MADGFGAAAGGCWGSEITGAVAWVCGGAVFAGAGGELGRKTSHPRIASTRIASAPYKANGVRLVTTGVSSSSISVGRAFAIGMGGVTRRSPIGGVFSGTLTAACSG